MLLNVLKAGALFLAPAFQFPVEQVRIRSRMVQRFFQAVAHSEQRLLGAAIRHLNLLQQGNIGCRLGRQTREDTLARQHLRCNLPAR